jgi:hypothetical protein
VQLTKSRTLRFRTAEYEHLETTVAITVDTDELGLGPQDVDQATEFMDKVLDSAQQVDIDRADEVSLTPMEATTIHTWKDSI